MNKIKEDISYNDKKNIDISYNERKKNRYFIQRPKKYRYFSQCIKFKISTFQKNTI